MTTQLEEARGMCEEIKLDLEDKKRRCEELESEIGVKEKKCKNLKDEVEKLTKELEKCQDDLKLRMKFEGNTSALNNMLVKKKKNKDSIGLGYEVGQCSTSKDSSKKDIHFASSSDNDNRQTFTIKNSPRKKIDLTTSVEHMKIKTDEQVDVIALKYVRVEVTTAKGEDEGQTKVDIVDGTQIPMAVTIEPLEREAKKEKVETKVEQILVARDVEDLAKGKQIVSDPYFIQGPINIDSLSPIQRLQLATFAQAKANIDLMKSHKKDCELMLMATSVLEKFLPSFKDTSSTPSNQLKSLLKSIDSHFVSLKKDTEAKLISVFNAKRMRTVLRMISGDKTKLVSCVKSIQDALVEGGKIYKLCLLLLKFTIEIEKKIKEHEVNLANLSQSFDPQSIFVSKKEDQVISLLDKIKSLNQEKDKIVGRVRELRSLITPQLDSFLSSLQDAHNANKSAPIDLRAAKMQAYLFSALISIF
ncbi:uncharacterized protein LOC131874258 [Cryptomeria japonica]|uniref:uncharacterized protein LOC131874258 n=1 Tax=Cryptomeria japonica TaxID=3369 RepID=UPI0027DA7E93|nr:uncharacterized protein LOC131874258 [Cryptomeria japonica]